VLCMSIHAHTVHSTHTSQVILCSHNTDVCTTSMYPHWTRCVILAKYWLLAPWWWFPCKPKHVRAASLILKCFNNSTFLTLLALVGHYSVWYNHRISNYIRTKYKDVIRNVIARPYAYASGCINMKAIYK
jgi:hypothetical protein